MARMQARNITMKRAGGFEPLNARKCIESDRTSSPMATGRKHLDGFFTPIGGATGLAGNNPVILTIQIVPCRMQVFRESILSLLRENDRDPSTAEICF